MQTLFFKGLIGKEQLVHTSEISFNARHPRDLCELKVNNLTNLYELTNSDVILFKGFQTDSYTFKIAVSDLNISICLDEKRTKNNVIIPNQYIVRSFRVGDEFERAIDKFEVSHILSKNKQQKYYDTLLFGDKQTINYLPTNIKNMIKL